MFLKVGIKSFRKILKQVVDNLVVKDNDLYMGNELISIILYQGAFHPNHFKLTENEELAWTRRIQIELSNAIVIPPI